MKSFRRSSANAASTRPKEKTNRRISLSNLGSGRLEVRRLPSAAAGSSPSVCISPNGVTAAHQDRLGSGGRVNDRVS